jgi:hypothetical protein
MLSMPRIVRPDHGRRGDRNLVPPLDRQLVNPLSETKNWQKLLTDCNEVKPLRLTREVLHHRTADGCGRNSRWPAAVKRRSPSCPPSRSGASKVAPNPD